MFIRSERLFLRPGWPEDWTELLKQIDDWAVIAQLIEMAETAKAPTIPAYPEVSDRRFPQFVVTLPTCNAPDDDGARAIGCAGLLSSEHGGELVYWIAPEYWGQGYATEAVRALLSLARTLGHRQIVALGHADNAASGRVLAKLGFHATGETTLRKCRARGVLTAPLVLRCDLGEPSDCDGGMVGDSARHAA